MAIKYPRPNPRDIVIPFMHVPSGDNSMRTANVAVLGAVTKSINRETRTALQMHRNFSINPSGVCEFEGEISIQQGMYITNMLSNLRKDSSGPIDRLYVTHTVRRCDIVAIEGMWVLTSGGMAKFTAYKCETRLFNEYKEDTRQKEFSVKAALVITTMHTTHACFIKVIPNTSDTVYTRYFTGGSIPLECAGFVDNTLITSATFYYPVQIQVSSMALQLNLTTDNTFKYVFNAQIHVDENKMAVL